MNALRLSDGVEAQLFTQRTGLPGAVARSPSGEPGPFAGRTGSTGGHAKGQLFLNDLLQYFLT